MEDKRSLGMTLCLLGNAIKRKTDECVASSVPCAATRTHSWIIGYLADHRGEDVFQRDIESALGIRRSTATGILQLMEKNGLITREPVEHDARLKKLILTPAAWDAHAAIAQVIEKNDRDMLSCLDEHEKDEFFAVCDKLIAFIGSSCAGESKESK